MSDAPGRLLRLFVRLAALPIIFSVVLIMKFAYRHRAIRIVVMDPRLFGHQSLEPEVFWDDWQSSVESGSRDVWLCCLGKKSAASNQYLWKHTRNHFPTVPSWFVTSISYWKERFEFSNLQLLDASIYRLGFLTQRATTLPLTTSILDRRREILSRLANPSWPYVVFTVRESSGLQDEVELRNRKIAEFLPAMDALIERGFNVVRLMSQTRDPLGLRSEHILDWQVLVNGEPGDELAIVSGAAFVVSTTTGGDCLALAYRRPVLYIDSARPYLVFLATELATFQVPRIEDRQTSCALTLAELLERGLGWSGEQQLFDDAGVRVVNSTPDEIRQYVVEYFASRNWHDVDPADENERNWRDLLIKYHGAEILKRHGPIRARLHPASRRLLLSSP